MATIPGSQRTLNLTASTVATYATVEAATTITAGTLLIGTTGVTAGGKVTSVTAGTANTDAVNLLQLNNATTGVLVYQGTWNASTNSPSLSSGVGTAGYYYIVSTAGTTSLDGENDWAIGDWAVFHSTWSKIDNSQVGNVTGSGVDNRLTLWNGTSDVDSNSNFFTTGTTLVSTQLAVGDGTDGYFFSDTAGRTAFGGGSFYIQDTVGTYYNYATNQYHGNSSGDIHYFRGNYLGGDNWNINTAGIITAPGGTSNEWNTAYDNYVASAAVTGTASKTMTFTQRDGGTFTAGWTDNNDNDNDYVSAATFDNTNGKITGTGSGSAGFVVDIDGRYPLSDVITASSTWDSSQASQHEFSGWDANGASWTPTTDWYWGMTLPHTSNSSTYNYSAQFAVQNASGANTYVRTVSNGTAAAWKQIWTSNNFTNNSSNWNTAYTDRLKWDGGSTGLVAATGRTSLGGTTIGANMFTLTNPSAITFPRFNANNTVSALSAANFRTAIGAGTSSSNFYLDGITKSGNTLTFSVNGTTNQDYIFGSNAFTSTTIYAEPGIFSGGGTPTLASGVTGAEIRTLIGAGTGSGTVTGTGTVNKIPLWNSTTGITDSNFSQGNVDQYSSNTDLIIKSLIGHDGNLKTAFGFINTDTFNVQINNIPTITTNATETYISHKLKVKSTVGIELINYNAANAVILSEENGNFAIGTIGAATTDTDKFLVSDGGEVKYRTGAQVRSDIGAGTGSGSVTSVNFKTDGTALNVASNSITSIGTMTGVWQGTSAQYVNGLGDLTTFPSIPQGDITGVTAGTYLSGGGTSGTVTLNVESGDFYRNVGSAAATVGGGWMTVASTQSGRSSGEVIVTDGDSGDHAYIRISWMRSYQDSNFSVLNCGGHANQIQGARVLYQNSDITYGWKYLQVYVTTSSHYYVSIMKEGSTPAFGNLTAVTPVIQNTISGYSLQGGELTGLQNTSLAAEEGITAGGDLWVNGGEITLGGTGRIQGIDTVSATTDAANKAYVDAHGGGTGPFLPISNPAFTGVLTGPTITTTGTVNCNELSIDGGDGIWMENDAVMTYSTGQLIIGDWDGGGFDTKIVGGSGSTVMNLTSSGISANKLLSVTKATSSSIQNTVAILKGDSSVDQNSSMTVDLDFYMEDNNTVTGIPQGRIGLVGSSTSSQSYEAAGRLAFYTTSRAYPTPVLTERMRIDGVGNVGIGATNPSEKLDVNGNIRAAGEYIANNVSFAYYDSANDIFNLGDWDGQGARLDLWADNTIGMTLNPSGNVSIGNINNTYKLDVSGTIRATGDVIAYSDARVKDNVETIENALDKVNQLRGISYTRNDTEDNSTKIGVIAQEVLDILPEVVQQDDEGKYSVAYGNMVGLLIEAIKEQDKKIERLEGLVELMLKGK